MGERGGRDGGDDNVASHSEGGRDLVFEEECRTALVVEGEGGLGGRRGELGCVHGELGFSSLLDHGGHAGDGLAEDFAEVVETVAENQSDGDEDLLLQQNSPFTIDNIYD